MAVTTSLKKRTGHPWLPAALLAGVTYAAIGIGFALLDRPELSLKTHFWRYAAWVVSALVFAAHTVYELPRRASSRFLVPLHVSIAVAVGAFLLAVWVLVHGRAAGAVHSPLAALALVLFPLATGLPAFAVALVATTLASKLHGRN